MQPVISSTVRTVRAVAVAFARRSLRPFIVGGFMVLAALLIIGGWLIGRNAWWWVFEIVFICATVVFAAMVIAVRLVLRRVEPTLTAEQRRAVNSFADKLERTAETLRTPYFMIVFYVVRDAIWPRSHSFIAGVAADSKTLRPDFEALRKQL